MNEFPIYRKLKNDKAFYKINSDIQFEEIQIIGSKRKYFLHEANQYPEKLKIMDMIEGQNGLYLPFTNEDWIRLQD